MNVSVALCTYNGEKYLREQLDSYAAQTHSVNELVVCDDGSTDGTVSILEAFSREAPFPVRIFINEVQLGVRRNFEKAISHCAGDLIFFSDQDDIWPAEKAAEFVVFAHAHPDRLGFFSNAYVLEANGVSDQLLWEVMGFTKDMARSLPFDDLCLFLLGRFNLVYGSMTAIRREALPLVQPFRTDDTGLWHDEWTSLSLAAVNKLAFINNPLLYYRQHPGQEVGLRQLALHHEIHALVMQLSISANSADATRLKMMEAWAAYQKAGRYAVAIPALKNKEAEFYTRAIEARNAFLKVQPFFLRKARIMKWAWNNTLDMRFKDILRY